MDWHIFVKMDGYIAKNYVYERFSKWVSEGEKELVSEWWVIEFTRERSWERDWLGKRVGESVSAPKEWET